MGTLGVGGKTEPLAFVIIVIGQTRNLRAPLLINYDSMMGKQIILTDTAFSVRHLLI